MDSIVFDLDHTICTPNLDNEDPIVRYLEAVPNDRIIEAIRKLKSRGFTIIINTARGMVSRKGDLNRIIEDLDSITREWLYKYNVPFDHLIFGKPYSTTYYVDDKGLSLDQFFNMFEKDLI